MRSANQSRAGLRRLSRWGLRWAARLAALSLLLGLALRWIDPPTTILIESERARLGGVTRVWRDLDRISPHLQRAAVAAEDARFCDHFGFDPAAIRDAVSDRIKGERLRGASTISQQTAKNVFLWPARSWARKALEVWFTVVIEATWSKRRTLEVYLNVAEFGEGVFGAEAAARRYFGVSAARLTARQAARLAVVLPSPRRRNPAALSSALRQRAAAVVRGAADLRVSGRDSCLKG